MFYYRTTLNPKSPIHGSRTRFQKRTLCLGFTSAQNLFAHGSQLWLSMKLIPKDMGIHYLQLQPRKPRNSKAKRKAKKAQSRFQTFIVIS